MFDPKGFGTPNSNRNKVLPNYYVTIPQLINDTHDDPENILDAEGKPLTESINLFKKSVKLLTKKLGRLKYKKNGPIDKISGKKKRYLRAVKNLYINLREQRIEAIEVENIIDNLITDGGFSYKSALLLSVIDNQKYKIRVTVDGMHRILMALLCGVDKVAVQELEEVLPNATQEEIEQIEHDLFDAANARSAKVDTSTQKCNNKKSGNMTEKEKKQDAAFADPRVRICVGTGSGAFGVRRSKTVFVYDGGFEEWWKILGVTSSKYYIGPDNFADIRDVLATIRTGKRCIDVALAYLLHKFDKHQSRQLVQYIKSNSFKNIDSEYWDGGVQHGNGVETVIFRIVSHLNEWYRELQGDNIVSLDTIPFLNIMNPETKSFVVGSLAREIKIESNQAMIEEFFDNYDDVQREENPYQEDFDEINDSLNTGFNTSPIDGKVTF
tara:strand:+ start:240 stop:1556 length:1317 start_codon:yes stop_codon:yes gene_type:complete